jgi:C4-dicarboxylate transporter DctM subunit
MVVNLAIGLFTPPFGLNLFVVMSVCNVSMVQVVRGLTPLLILYLTGLMLVSFIPMLSLWLPIAFYR